jgi:hypothetical protein
VQSTGRAPATRDDDRALERAIPVCLGPPASLVTRHRAIELLDRGAVDGQEGVGLAQTDQVGDGCAFGAALEVQVRLEGADQGLRRARAELET